MLTILLFSLPLVFLFGPTSLASVEFYRYPDFKSPTHSCLQKHTKISTATITLKTTPAPIDRCPDPQSAPWCTFIHPDECTTCVQGCNPCRPVIGGWVCHHCSKCYPMTWSLYTREGFLCGTSSGNIVKTCCGTSYGFSTLCKPGICAD